jgi:hypothetical protein
VLSNIRAALIAAAVVLLALTPIAAPAYADDPVECDPLAWRCDVIIELPEAPGDPEIDPVTGITPGPAECLRRIEAGKYEVIACQSDRGSWSNADQCYWSLDDPQRPPPPGKEPGGAWYTCSGFDWFTVGEYRLNPPPGLGLTPGQAAMRVIQGMTFEGLDIGMAPQVNPAWGYRRSYVGVPIWLWAESRTAQNWGPYVVTATLGGQTITVDAKVTSVLWQMGDGGTEACANEGTEYQVSYGVVDSPTCGYRYQQMSNDQPGGKYTVTATSQWSIDWSGGGQNGTIPLTTQSTDNVEIRELQSVNVNPQG